MLAWAVMYAGIANAVFPRRVPNWFPGQRVAGSIVVASGAALKLEEGHQLATGGPFRILRHPIYMGLNLLALGTAVWVPTVLVGVGFVLMAAAGDLRARAEEALLELEYKQARLINYNLSAPPWGRSILEART